MNSTCLNHLKRDGYSEVTGIVHVSGRGLFLSVGWDRRIITFRDNTDVSTKKNDSDCSLNLLVSRCMI